MMRVAVISDREFRGGAAQATSRLVEGLCALPDVDVARFVLHKESTSSRTISINDCGNMWVVFSALVDLLKLSNMSMSAAMFRARAMRLLRRKLQEFQPDIINIHGFNQYARPRVKREELASLSSIAPIVWTLHDLWPLTGCLEYEIAEVPIEGGLPTNMFIQEMLSRNEKLFSQQLKENVAAYVAPSLWMRKTCDCLTSGNIRCFHVPYGMPKRLVVSGNGMFARQFLGLPADRFIILFVAEMLSNKMKGIERVMSGRNETKGVHYLTVGRINATSARLWPKETTHLGVIADERLMSLVYCAADVLAVPSLTDNLPNVLLEAMASGVPCAAYRVGGMPDIIKDGETGVLASDGDVQSFWNAIDRVREMSEDSRNRMGEQCVQTITDTFSMRAQVERYLKVYTFSQTLRR